MSYVKTYAMTCDHCGNECDYSGYTLAEARKVAREEGWKLATRRHPSDLCGECRPQDEPRSREPVVAIVCR